MAQQDADSTINSRPDSKIERFRMIDVPQCVATKGFRPPVEQYPKLLQGLKELCAHPSGGVLVVAGGGGIGKTMLLANIFTSPCLGEYFINNCNIRVAIRVNCLAFRGDQFNEEAFVAKLTKLAAKAEQGRGSMSSRASESDNDEGATRQSIGQAISRLRDTLPGRAVLVLDNVYGVKIVEFVRQQLASVACCVVTRDPVPLMRSSNGLVRDLGVFWLHDYADETIAEMLGDTFGLKDKLPLEKIQALAKRCFGSPLVARLLADRLSILGVENFEDVLTARICDLDVEPSSHRTVSELMNFSIELLEPQQRHRFYAFLLFGRDELVPLKDLAILWGLLLKPTDDEKTALQEADSICLEFEKKSLIRRVINSSLSTPQSVSHSFGVNGLLYEAAVDNAKRNLADCTSGGALYTALKLGAVNQLNYHGLDTDKALLAIMKAAKRQESSQSTLARRILEPTEVVAFLYGRYPHEIMMNTFKLELL